MLKKFACAVLLTLAAASSALAGKQDFVIVNQTGYTLDQLYVSPTKSDEWEEDVLGKDVLANGESTKIVFDRSETTCNWDIKVVYDDGEDAVWEKIDLCKTEKITIKWNKNTGVTTATLE